MIDLRRHLQRPGQADKAFSLVEVVLALGIAAFALIAIVGMLPIGLRLASDADEESRAINIMTQIAADRRAITNTAISTIYKLPPLPSGTTVSNTFAVGEAGSYLDQNFGSARYRVTYRLTPPRSGSGDPWLLWLRTSWPANTTNGTGTVESLNSIPGQ